MSRFYLLRALNRSSSGQISVAINKKHRVVEIVFFSQSMQECSSWIGASPSEDSGVKDEA